MGFGYKILYEIGVRENFISLALGFSKFDLLPRISEVHGKMSPTNIVCI